MKLRVSVVLLAICMGLVGCTTDSVSYDAPDPQPEAAPDAQPEAAPDAQPEAAPDAQPEAQPDAQPEAQPDPEPEAQPDPEPEAQPDPEPEAQPDPEPEPDMNGGLEARITAPADGEVYEEGTQIVVEGVVGRGMVDAQDLVVTWLVDDQARPEAPTLDELGNVSLTLDGVEPGNHEVTLRVQSNEFGPVEATVRLGVCVFDPPVDFNEDLDPNEWMVLGDAFRDPGGWLEVTGLGMGRKGAIYNVSRFINPGDVSIRFKIYTGGGTGADGYSMNIFNVQNTDDLRTLFNRAASGSGLGYGIYNDRFEGDIEAFHIEFDTWENRINPNGDPFDDPTSENHVGVLLDADPGAHYLWAEIPSIEDSRWHDVAIEVNGSNVQVFIDDVSVINDEIMGLAFKGGYIGFSGTTGFYTNLHRIDDLQIRQGCTVP